MTEPAFIAHETRAGLVEALAAAISHALAESVTRREAAGLVVSGGSTPKPLFERLSGEDLPWERVTVTLADERCAPAAEGVRNDALVRGHLLRGRATEARFLPLAEAGTDPQGEAAEAEARLDAFPWPADITLLGMGADGHTASWFPGAEALDAVLDPAGIRRCLALTPAALPEEAPYPRLTLTRPAVLDSARILVMLTGETKRAAYERARDGDDTAAMPIRAVLQQSRVPVDVHWAA